MAKKKVAKTSEEQLALEKHIEDLKIVKIDIISVDNQHRINGVYIDAQGFTEDNKLCKGFDADYLAEALREKVRGEFGVDYDDLKALAPQVDFYQRGALLQKYEELDIEDDFTTS